VTDRPESGFLLAVHGGAGDVGRGSLDIPAHRQVLGELLREGFAALRAGAPALDVVERAVCRLEDCELYNAGRGSVLTSAGAVEMDAAIADGRARRTGAVAVLRRVRNPVRAARAVLESGRHVLLVGEGAERFAAECGLPLETAGWFVTPARAAELERARAGETGAARGGTVGAVARDAAGHLAAATSTGGKTGQWPGRVGDSPLVGAGTWADDATCAVSGTGDGEIFVRCAFAHEIDARIRLTGEALAVACDAALARVRELGGRGGVVALGPAGPAVLAFDTPAMVRGFVDATGRVRVAILRDDEAEVP
jgi:isoaspartyl peptidase/L-asparaginase-like protein (Ntn-hydrolase superfamily)